MIPRIASEPLAPSKAWILHGSIARSSPSRMVRPSTAKVRLGMLLKGERPSLIFFSSQRNRLLRAAPHPTCRRSAFHIDSSFNRSVGYEGVVKGANRGILRQSNPVLLRRESSSPLPRQPPSCRMSGEAFRFINHFVGR